MLSNFRNCRKMKHNSMYVCMFTDPFLLNEVKT